MIKLCGVVCLLVVLFNSKERNKKGETKAGEVCLLKNFIFVILMFEKDRQKAP